MEKEKNRITQPKAQQMQPIRIQKQRRKGTLPWHLLILVKLQDKQCLLYSSLLSISILLDN